MKLGDRVRVKCAAIQYPGRCGIVLADSARGELVEVEFEDEAIAHLFTEDELQPLLDPAHHYLETTTVRVLVVDDFERFRRFVCSTLGKRRDLQVIGEASDGLEAVRKTEELEPDLILLDIGLPTLNGIEVARRIRMLVPECKILFLTQESSVDLAQEAFSSGAMGYVVKVHAGRELLPAVDAVCQGRQFVSKGLTSHNWISSTDGQGLAPR
jgi:CheY-like chemotaxis protein